MLRYVLFVDSGPKDNGISCRTARGALEKTIGRLVVKPTNPSFRQLLEAMPCPSQAHIAFCGKCFRVADVLSEEVELARL